MLLIFCYRWRLRWSYFHWGCPVLRFLARSWRSFCCAHWAGWVIPFRILLFPWEGVAAYWRMRAIRHSGPHFWPIFYRGSAQWHRGLPHIWGFSCCYWGFLCFCGGWVCLKFIAAPCSTLICSSSLSSWCCLRRCLTTSPLDGISFSRWLCSSWRLKPVTTRFPPWGRASFDLQPGQCPSIPPWSSFPVCAARIRDWRVPNSSSQWWTHSFVSARPVGFQVLIFFIGIPWRQSSHTKCWGDYVFLLVRSHQ